VIVAIFCSIVLLHYYFNFKWDVEDLFIKNPESVRNIPNGRISPITASLLIFLCICILVIKYSKITFLKYIGGISSLLVFIISSILLLGYFYKAPLLYGSQIIPVSLPTAFCFWLFSITLLRIVELKYWTFNLKDRNPTEFILLKSFLPIVVGVVLIQGFLITNFSLQRDNQTLSVAFILILVVAITVIVVFRATTIIGFRLKKAEQALNESENKLLIYQYSRSLIEASLDPLVTISPEGKITDLNKATEDAIGYSRDSLIGTDFSDYFTEPDKARKVYEKVFELGYIYGYPLTLRHISDKLISVLYNASVYRDKNGQIIGVFAAARDISDLKRVQEDLKRKMNDLTVANKELETFSYSVSHDLRAPLRHINGYVDLLMNRFYDSLPEKARHYLDTIADSSRQMDKLINDLLQFSRISRQEKRSVDIDMNIIVNEVLEPIKKETHQKNIEWRIATLPKIYGDQALLQLVWTNIISNAVKFSRTREKPIIEINVLDENDEFIFSIHDNGVGFDMKYAQKLFGVFQRLHPIDEFEGTGIGLANVHHIISRHGGRTWAEAEPDKGATFYFSLSKYKENQS
jgi:PAS domain S-box-containing protein